MPIAATFPVQAKARAKLVAGELYAIGGGDGFVYYGQKCADPGFGFFRYRSTAVDAEAAYAAEVMSRFLVVFPSVGRALRSGHWLCLGRREPHPQLVDDVVVVNWPVGTTTVTLLKGSTVLGHTDAADPKIQSFEIIAAYDAIYHVPERLQADYLESPDSWKVGGSVRRRRLMKEDSASRFPDQPWHQLPSNWKYTRDD